MGPRGPISPRTLNRAIDRALAYLVISGAQVWIAPLPRGADADALRFVSWVNASAQHYRYG